MKRVALYMRVSSTKQVKEGDSIPAQRDALTKYAKEKGYSVAGEYLDDGNHTDSITPPVWFCFTAYLIHHHTNGDEAPAM